MRKDTYRVGGCYCPVIVMGPDYGMGSDDAAPERCSAAVEVTLWSTASGRGRGDLRCLEGHTLADMAHDNALDLDGVPEWA